MKRPHRHLLRVEHGAEVFAPVFRAARIEGLRVGWLTLDAVEPPPILAQAAGLGALRAVSVGAGGSVAVKPMRGAPVLRDLLREHFRGCALVLIAGDDPRIVGSENLPLLARVGDAWEVRTAAGENVDPVGWSATDLVSALRRPRPW